MNLDGEHAAQLKLSVHVVVTVLHFHRSEGKIESEKAQPFIIIT